VGPLDQIIPPSIPFIVWGVIAEQSITRLFLSGVVPGIIHGIAYMVVCYFIAKRAGIGKEPRATFNEILQAFYDGKWALFAPVIILGGIYGGVFTPTEVSMIGVACGFVIGIFVYREIQVSDIIPIILRAMRTTAVVMFHYRYGRNVWLAASVRAGPCQTRQLHTEHFRKQD